MTRTSLKPLLESLEDRTVPATFTTTTFADGTGPGTLRYAITQANTNGQDNTIILGSGTYMLSPANGGELAVTGAGHALTIVGTGQTIIHAGGASRDFEVVGNVQLTLQNLTLAGGLASDGGSIGGADARGGAMLINGGNVTLQGVAIAGDVAQGKPGANAFGGGIYANVATLTIINSAITGNRAQGGAGAAGGGGGSGQAGAAGQGGGAALGGGLYVVGGSLSISGTTFSGNTAVGGDGGAGGQGGNRNIPTPTPPPAPINRGGGGGFFGPGFFPYGFGPYGYGFGPYGYGAGYGPSFYGSTGFSSGPFSSGGFSSGGFSGGGFSGSVQAAATGSRGGDGGVGGAGGKAQGGGLYLAGGMINLGGVTFSGNHTQGGTGGPGGNPGTGNPSGVGGDGGAGGLSQGAAVYVASGSAVLNGTTFNQDITADGLGGTPGSAGSGSPSFGFTQVGQGERVFRASGGVIANPPLSAQDTVGTFDPGWATWYLRNEANGGPADAGVFVYGGRGWRPVVGDWNGDGVDTVGVVDPNGVWYLRNENSPGSPDIKPFAFGAPGWIPVVGDWSGTGHTGIGMFDPSTGTWYLRNEDSPGPPDAGVFRYGGAGWRPVVGDWRGDGTTTVGAVDPASETWYLRDSNSAGPPTIPVFRYGSPGWVPVAGDWTNNGTMTVGAVNPDTGTWYLRNENSHGAADAGVFAYGAPHWRYFAGHWHPPSGQGERAAGGAVARAHGAGGITGQQLQQTVSAALERLKEAGASPAVLARLASVHYEVGQLHGSVLGYAYAKAHTVVLDTNAAGYGWFVDPTPLSDEEFARTASGALTALPNGPAAGHMDLLTVVLHEMGHISGRGDVSPAGDANYLMDDALPTGQRRTDALDAVFSGTG